MKKIKTLGLITLGAAVMISASACTNTSNSIGGVKNSNGSKSIEEKATPSNANNKIAQTRLQDNLYEAVNAKWLKATELPADKVIAGGLVDLDTDVKKLVSEDLSKMADEGRDKTDDEIGNMVKFYKLAADREKLDKQGFEAIKADIQTIKSTKSLAELAKNQKDLYFKGLALPFSLNLLSDMKDATKNALYIEAPAPAMLDKSYYAPENPQSEVFLGLYKKMLTDLLVMVGETDAEAAQIAGEAVDFEKEYVQHTLSSAEASNFESFYNPKTISEFKAYSKSIDLEKFLVDVVGKVPSNISVMSVNYFENLDTFLNEKNWDKIKSWTYANFVLKSSSMLSDDFVNTSTQLGRAITGQEKMTATADTVYNIVNSSFKYVVGNYYGETHLGAAARQDVTDMVENMIDIYRDKLRSNDWMSEETKKEAIKKLDNLKTHIGYPDKLEDMYASFKVDESKTLFENNRAIQTIITKNNFAKLDKPVDRDEWRMSANTANASYQPLTNTITIPAAALQAPFYDKNQSASQNYGGIGTIIAHEISHGFDTNGAKYDEIGNMINWWTEADYKKFEVKAKAVIDQYSKIDYLGQKINGEMTVSENIADIGGVMAALEAVKQLPDANLNEFYKSYSTIWRQKVRPELEQLLLTIDAHAPNKIRVNVVAGNTDDFYSAFNVKEGDAMYIAPEERLTLW
ncbi:M13-type metalloendopeptidase [Paenibacillus gorillae]|uniref:M13-type metalloendopeptidase n=1 Tax=Paenibacillus gorillae TaxID=1243662 RepID=UPI0004BC6648|nr:M13 family metallopeptidase [Paenibacillus gorillae]